MIGNVREWVEDDYHSTYNGAPANGSAWIDNPRGTYGVLRGGAWGSGGTASLRSSTRNNVDHTQWYSYYGFRCAQ